jgi:hypothetical protein
MKRLVMDVYGSLVPFVGYWIYHHGLGAFGVALGPAMWVGFGTVGDSPGMAWMHGTSHKGAGFVIPVRGGGKNC